ncbi:MAG: hypothetical protein ACR2OS_07250, partial [Paracoccaceae bacterium]
MAHNTVHNFAIGCFDKAIFIHTCEGRHHVAQANAVVDVDGNLVEELITCRYQGDVLLVP